MTIPNPIFAVLVLAAAVAAGEDGSGWRALCSWAGGRRAQAERGAIVKHEFIEVRTTAAKREDAARIAGVLVEKRLAACAQIVGPIASTYWWQGKVETAEEWLCLAKARKEDYRKIERAIKELHPYQMPEIIAVPVCAGSTEYLRWVREETKRG